MMTRNWMPLRMAMAAGAFLFSCGSAAAGIEYYVGVDGRPAMTSGVYSGLENPNFGRLSLLVVHGNHYHPIGAYSYVGTPPDETVVDTNTNNRLPETYTGLPPLSLTPGSGLLYGDKLVTMDTAAEYDNLALRSVDELAGAAAGSPEAALFASSGGRWTTMLAGTDLLLQLVSIDDGLNVGSSSELNLFDGGVHDTWRLGAGETLGFDLVLWTALDATPGTYSVGMRLIDANGLFNPSGTFYFDTEVAAPVPLPATIALIGPALLVIRRRVARNDVPA